VRPGGTGPGLAVVIRTKMEREPKAIARCPIESL
jgi:hypothetical protein